ncbi:MAG TPA: hypothetical protein VIV55_13480 [Flavobacterium sp.]
MHTSESELTKYSVPIPTEMSNFIEKSEIDYWIYGHHHCNVFNFTVGKTKLVTNQLGYIKYRENENFRNDAVFSI